jgi:peptidoglycan/xylan/chitin deacetylase (PgdA/CDA1 family)
MRLGSLVRNKLSPPAIILAYHRVAELNTDPWGLAVSPQNFSAQLEVLQTAYKPDALSSLVDTGSRAHTTNAVAVTFDDGYADNLLTAKPLLEQSGIPATFFIPVGGIDARMEFWWDALERIILQTDSLPELLTLATANGPSDWSTSRENDPPRHGSSSGGSLGPTGRFDSQVSPVRIRLYYRLWELLMDACPTERARLVRQLHDWSGVPLDARESHRTLTRDELIQLSDGDQMSVGAHSVTHTPLSLLDYKSQREEIERGKQSLERLLGASPLGFAYPHGDHDERIRQLVADSGYAFACTTQSGVVLRSTPRFQLPRCTVLDWSGGEFSARLRRWQNTRQE